MWTFIWGFAGSIGFEVVNVHLAYGQGRALPARYKKIDFWVVRFLLALFGGGLAVAYEVEKPILAVQIGVCAPCMVQMFLKKGPFAGEAKPTRNRRQPTESRTEQRKPAVRQKATTRRCQRPPKTVDRDSS